MHKTTATIALTVSALAARRYFRNWGATRAECATALPRDELIPDPAVVTTQAVWVEATPAEIWPWLVQLGQDRAGMYSYEALENLIGLDIHNADRIHDEWQSLAPGDVVRLVPKGWLGVADGVAMPVAAVLPEKAIVLREQPPDMPWNAVWSFHIVPHWEDRCRLIARSRLQRQGVAGVITAELGSPVTSLMTRKMLLGIKDRVESARELRALLPTQSGPSGPDPIDHVSPQWISS